MPGAQVNCEDLRGSILGEKQNRSVFEENKSKFNQHVDQMQIQIQTTF